jgi:DNA replication protein DnaC
MCEIAKETEKVEKAEKEAYKRDLQLEKYNMFKNKSLLTDETLLAANFDNYKTEFAEEVGNKAITRDVIDRYKKGEVFNTIIQGEPGAGKSHLAISILKELNESGNLNTSCLFVSVEDMFRRLKNSFSDKQSRYTETYFIELLSKADFLVLDDLGAETGAIDSDKVATDFVQRVLYGVMNYRQNKPTITTMNLSGVQIRDKYDSKLISRIFKKPKYIVFKETKDKRINDMPF